VAADVRSVATFLVVFIPMLIEARRSRRHERALRRAGAREPAGDVYALMQVAYPLFFLAMIAEGWWRGTPVGPWTWLGVFVFAVGKGVKY
jgi:isoprenylcysteine carboxyl methyltransferase (ICMT) family protein YpbQ